MPDKQNNRPLFVIIGIAVFLVLCIFPLNAQEGKISSGKISSIEVIGLKRTKPYIVHYALERFIGMEGSSLDINEVQAAVKDTGILEPVSVELAETEEGLALRITVTEKWSIFPFPFVSAGSGENSFGLFLLDTNAFGIRDQAAIGGMYSPSSWMAIAMYNHTPNRKGQPGWNSSFMYGRREREDMDKDEDIHRRFTVEQLRFSLGLYYPLTEHFTVSGTGSFSRSVFVRNDNSFNQPENGAMLLSFTPGISVRYSDWDGYLISQQSINLNYTYNFALTGSSFQQAELRVVFEKSLVPGFRFNFRSGASWKSGSDPLFEEGPRKALVDILPRDYSAKHYAGFSAGFEKYLVKTKMGTLSALASWQGVFSHGPISDNEFNNGPSGGIRFYLSRLALPAMGVDLAYNLNSGLFQVTFNMGMWF